MVLRNYRAVQATVISALLLVSTVSIIQWSTAQVKGTFTADLTPSPGSNATGKATLELQDNGKSVKYTVSGSGVNNVTAITISQIMGSGRAPDVVSLRQPSQSGLGPTSGSLSGNFTASDLIGPLNGKGMADFVKAILDGKIIFRVSTTAFPLGEIVGNVTAGGAAGGNMTAG
jgi:CHRD domain